MNGTPLRKCGDPGEPPCPQPSQATADAAAETSVNNAPKIYDGDFQETGRRQVAGGQEVSYSRNFTQKGTGEATKTYEELASEGGDVEAAQKWNAARNKSGTETKTRTIFKPINLEPRGFNLPTMLPEAAGEISIPPQKVEYTPVETPAITPTTSDQGFNSTHKYKKAPKKKKKRVNYTTAGGDCGCK